MYQCIQHLLDVLECCSTNNVKVFNYLYSPDKDKSVPESITPEVVTLKIVEPEIIEPEVVTPQIIVPTTKKKGCGDVVKADVIFLLDESGSVKAKGWKLQRAFIKKMIGGKFHIIWLYLHRR